MADSGGSVVETTSNVTLADPRKGRNAGYLFSTSNGTVTLPSNCEQNTLALDLYTKTMYYFDISGNRYSWTPVGGGTAYQGGRIDS